MADAAAVEAGLISVPNSAFPGRSLRVFSDASINAAITQALAQPMAEGKTGAVTIQADLRDVKLVLAIKNNNWSVVTVAGYDYANHDVEAGVSVMYSW